MTEQVYVVGAYVSNDDPLLRVRAFVPLPDEYRTLDAAVAAIEKDFQTNNDPAAEVAFVVYQAAGGDAVVEVSRGAPFSTAGFYKVARVAKAG
jgi:hypothetical protein